MNNLFQQRREHLASLKQLRIQKAGGHPASGAQADPLVTCPACSASYSRSALAQDLYVCPGCGHHYPIGAYTRLHLLVDKGSFRELNRRLISSDPLTFPGYAEKLESQTQKTGLFEAAVTGTGRIGGRPAALAVLDSRFLMGSMSAAVGEKITRIIEHAQKASLPLVIFCASGGARMQEGIFSLMQMAKTAAALERFQQKGGLYVAFLTHPTTGGVSASFAGLGDITLAEPGALIGFAGPRVIEQTIGQKLPEGFQRAEYLEEHGFVDRIVPRCDMRRTLALLLRLHDRKGNAG